MLSRLVSLTLTLIMIGVSLNLIRQSMTLAKLRDQVAEMEGRLGNALPPDESKIWIKLVESGPEAYAWRLYLPPIKAFVISLATTGDDGKWLFGSGSSVGSSKSVSQQTMIRISRSEFQGKSSYFFSVLNSRSEGYGYANMPGTGEPLPDEAIEFEAFAADSEKTLDLDTPIPLLRYHAKEEFVQDKLKDGTINQTQADQLRTTQTWYFGTPEGMKKIGYPTYGLDMGAR